MLEKTSCWPTCVVMQLCLVIISVICFVSTDETSQIIGLMLQCICDQMKTVHGPVVLMDGVAAMQIIEIY